MEGSRHLAAYLYDRDAHLPIRPVVKDGACLRSGCHATEQFQDKTIKYGEKSTFRHKAHFEKETLKGQKLFCDTCHVKHSAAKHFEVPMDICFTCHFRPGNPKGPSRSPISQSRSKPVRWAGDCRIQEWIGRKLQYGGQQMLSVSHCSDQIAAAAIIGR